VGQAVAEIEKGCASRLGEAMVLSW